MSGPTDNHETLLFVVRLWRETDTDRNPLWRGRVEHIGSQAVGFVEDVAEVTRFIERWTRPDDKEIPVRRQR